MASISRTVGLAVSGLVAMACAGGDRPPWDTTASRPTSAPQTVSTPPQPVQGMPGEIIPGSVALGDSIFHGRVPTGICYTCHGPDARGTQLGPNLTDGQWLHGDGSLGFIVNTVTNGVSMPKQYPSVMPPFGQTLSPEQIRAVATYVHSLSQGRPL